MVTAEPCLSGILMKSGKQWQSLRMDSGGQVTEEEGEAQALVLVPTLKLGLHKGIWRLEGKVFLGKGLESDVSGIPSV